MIALQGSVLIPVYNGGRFLAEWLDSILARDYADLEILIHRRQFGRCFAVTDPTLCRKNIALSAGGPRADTAYSHASRPHLVPSDFMIVGAQMAVTTALYAISVALVL